MTKSREYLIAAMHALRSYQHGNSSPDLAEEIADAIEKYLKENPSDSSEGSSDTSLVSTP